MDAITVGNIIAALRRQHGMNQSQLAQKLNVSNKAVSRWESGQGYPEITQFPLLAEIFGVTVDYLLTGKRRGITLAGNILTDQVKTIDSYPTPGMLSNITAISRAVGGCVPNTAINLARLDRKIPLSALGCVGDDEQGRYVLGQMRSYGIDVEGVSILPEHPTSFSDVMNLPSGERTFFHARGANAHFSPDSIDMNSLHCSILHIGYILLLDAFDAADETYGTVMARFLHNVQERGIRTSIDVVSDSTGQYQKTILPALRYCDYAIMNEIEGCAALNLSPRHADGSLHLENIRSAMEQMVQQGVRSKVVLHSKEACFCLDAASGAFTAVPSLKIDPKDIRGSTGAGDAFCAGCLYGIYNDYTDEEMLRFASAAAACNLFSENSVDGMLPWQEVRKMEQTHPRLEVAL